MRTGSSIREKKNFPVWCWWLCKGTDCYSSNSFGPLISPSVWFWDIASPSVSLHPQWKMPPLQCGRHRRRIEHKRWNLDHVLSFSKPWHEVNIISMLFTTPSQHLTTLKVPLSSRMKAPPHLVRGALQNGYDFSEKCISRSYWLQYVFSWEVIIEQWENTKALTLSGCFSLLFWYTQHVMCSVLPDIQPACPHCRNEQTYWMDECANEHNCLIRCTLKFQFYTWKNGHVQYHMHNTQTHTLNGQCFGAAGRQSVIFPPSAPTPP